MKRRKAHAVEAVYEAERLSRSAFDGHDREQRKAERYGAVLGTYIADYAKSLRGILGKEV